MWSTPQQRARRSPGSAVKLAGPRRSVRASPGGFCLRSIDRPLLDRPRGELAGDGPLLSARALKPSPAPRQKRLLVTPRARPERAQRSGLQRVVVPAGRSSPEEVTAQLFPGDPGLEAKLVALVLLFFAQCGDQWDVWRGHGVSCRALVALRAVVETAPDERYVSDLLRASLGLMRFCGPLGADGGGAVLEAKHIACMRVHVDALRTGKSPPWPVAALLGRSSNRSMSSLSRSSTSSASSTSTKASEESVPPCEDGPTIFAWADAYLGPRGQLLDAEGCLADGWDGANRAKRRLRLRWGRRALQVGCQDPVEYALACRRDQQRVRTAALCLRRAGYADVAPCILAFVPLYPLPEGRFPFVA